MEPSVGDLVGVETGGPQIDGIVCEVLHGAKVIVAVIDRDRGPVLRTVQRTALSERTEPGPDDRALGLLIRRTHASGPGGTGRAAGGGPGRPGHTRAATHRPTGR